VRDGRVRFEHQTRNKKRIRRRRGTSRWNPWRRAWPISIRNTTRRRSPAAPATRPSRSARRARPCTSTSARTAIRSTRASETIVDTAGRVGLPEAPRACGTGLSHRDRDGGGPDRVRRSDSRTSAHRRASVD
jgi:hypothetical protein